MQEGGKHGKDGEDMNLRHTEQLRWVHVIPVAEFMCQNCLDFVRLAFFDQGVEDDDVFAPRQSEEVSVAMRTTLGTVDLIQMLQGELELRRERFSPCT